MTDVPNTRTFTDGVLTSSDLNTYISEPLTFLRARPAASLRQTVLQSLTSSVYTAITFDVEDYDSHGQHSTSVSTSRFTAVYPGWYRGGGGASFAASAVGQRDCRWAVNGTAVNGSETFIDPAAAFTTCIPARTVLFFLNAGDYAELQAMQSSGGALNTEVGATTGSYACLVWERVA